MSTSSLSSLARVATLAALLAVPSSFAFAADGAATQQSPAPQSQQAQVLGTTAAAPITNGNDTAGDDPYAVVIHREGLRFQAQKGFSNEPNWKGLEYQTIP